MPTVLQASYHAGKKRAGWSDLKKISKLQLAKARENDIVKKVEIQGEISLRKNSMKGEEVPAGTTLTFLEK